MKTNAFSFFNSDVATKFENNFRKRHPDSSDSILKFLYGLGSDPDMIECAFVWEDTPEGHEYWETISDLWKEFVVGKRMPLPEGLDAEEVGLQKRLEAKLQEVKPSPVAVIEEFRSLFGEQVLNLFKQNFETESDQYRESQNLLDFLKDQIDMSRVDNVVDSAFVWCNTPEGPVYWKRIHETWKTYWRVKAGVQED